MLSEDVATDPRFSHELFRRFPHQSGLVVPLVLDELVAGAFYLVWWTTRRQLTAREHEILASMTAQVTVLLRNARLFEKAERERRQLGVMYELARRMAAVRDEPTSSCRSSSRRRRGCSVPRPRPSACAKGTISCSRPGPLPSAEIMMRPRIKVDDSLTGRVVSMGQALAVEDLADDRRLNPVHLQRAVESASPGTSVSADARRAFNRPINVYTKERRAFTPDDVNLLSALADQASAAIIKKRLLREAEERGPRSSGSTPRARPENGSDQAVRGHSQLASSLDVDRNLDQIVGKTVDLLGSDAAGIYTYDERRGNLTFRRGLNVDPTMTGPRARARRGCGRPRLCREAGHLDG